MTPYIAALDHCIVLLGQCKQAEVSLLISNEQIVLMKPRSVQNRVLFNLSHQLTNLIVKDVGAEQSVVMSQKPDHSNGEDTQFTLRTVVMKATTYVDLLQGLNVLRAAALEQVDDDELDTIVNDRQYEMFLEA